MGIDFNQETQRLVLKPEYAEAPTETTVRKPAFGGLVYEEIRTFDPSIATEEEYADYWHRGFYFIFDVVEKI